MKELISGLFKGINPNKQKLQDCCSTSATAASRMRQPKWH
jgi:hypothetical protein